MQTTFERVSYYGIHTFLVVLLPIVTMTSLPRRRPWAFQAVMLVCVWWPGWSELIELRVCGYLATGVGEPARCAGKDFLNAMFCASTGSSESR